MLLYTIWIVEVDIEEQFIQIASKNWSSLGVKFWPGPISNKIQVHRNLNEIGFASWK